MNIRDKYNIYDTDDYIVCEETLDRFKTDLRTIIRKKRRKPDHKIIQRLYDKYEDFMELNIRLDFQFLEKYNRLQALFEHIQYLKSINEYKIYINKQIALGYVNIEEPYIGKIKEKIKLSVNFLCKYKFIYYFKTIDNKIITVYENDKIKYLNINDNIILEGKIQEHIDKYDGIIQNNLYFLNIYDKKIYLKKLINKYSASGCFIKIWKKHVKNEISKRNIIKDYGELNKNPWLPNEKKRIELYVTLKKKRNKPDPFSNTLKTDYIFKTEDNYLVIIPWNSKNLRQIEIGESIKIKGRFNCMEDLYFNRITDAKIIDEMIDLNVAQNNNEIIDLNVNQNENEIPLNISNTNSEYEKKTIISKRTDRSEQCRLRNYLIKNKESKCIICDEENNVECLQAAHLKEHKILDNADEVDDVNIVEFMCASCHLQYDKGFISVNSGKLIISQENENKRYQTMNGKKIEAYNKKNESYFKWHFDNIFKN